MKQLRRYILTGLLILSVVSCKENKLIVVESPQDIDENEMTTPPDENSEQSLKKILIIGINGLRGDAMEKADAPHIKALLPHSIYSYDALTESTPLEAPGWTSLLTGVGENKHRVTDNSSTSSNSRYPSIFKYVKKITPNYNICSVGAWEHLDPTLFDYVDTSIDVNTDEAVQDSAVAVIQKGTDQILLLQFDEVNQAGNQFGFDTTVNEYMNSITNVDTRVGEVIDALENKKDWLIIIASDHGGDLNPGGPVTFADQNIFTLFYNEDLEGRQILPPDNVLKATKMEALSQMANLKDPENLIDFNQYEGFSVHLNVKCDRISGFDAFITNKDWSTGNKRGWIMSMNEGTDWQWGFNAGDGSSNRVDLHGGEIADGQWHSLAVTVDKNANARLFQDDSLFDQATARLLVDWNGDFESNDGVKLNSGDDITNTISSRYGNSIFTVANIQIWDTVIAEEDIKQYVSCDSVFLEGKYDDNIIAWWKGTDGEGEIWEDSGPYQLDMEILGQPKWEEQQFDFCNNRLPPTVPTIVDIVPSIIDWLGIPQDSGWDLDGISWLSVDFDEE